MVVGSLCSSGMVTGVRWGKGFEVFGKRSTVCGGSGVILIVLSCSNDLRELRVGRTDFLRTKDTF